MADCQCPAGRGCRSPHRRRRTRTSSPKTMPDSGATRVSVFTPDRGGSVLPDLRGSRGGRRKYHRRAHPHHARRHGARQSAGGRCTRPRPMPTGGCGSAWSDRSKPRSTSRTRRRCPMAASPRPRTAFRRRAVGGDRRARVEPHHRRRGQRARPPGAARGAGRGDPRCGPRHPFGAYRHLWRARGRRLLSDAARRQEAERRDRASGCARHCSMRRATPAEARAA